MSNINLVDGFNRHVSYLRLSLTDRCDLRCLYCMSERPEFSPKRDRLNSDEIDLLLTWLGARGIRKVRLTGGEPLVRNDFLTILEKTSTHDFDELTLTTNGSLLAFYAQALADHGVLRVNVSLDSLKEDVFSTITRGGKLERTLQGIDEAQKQGLKVKINLVALAHMNEAEIGDIMVWAHQRGCDMVVIETMPMSDTGFDLTKYFLPLERVRTHLENQFSLIDDNGKDEDSSSAKNLAKNLAGTSGHLAKTLAGPARYKRVQETGGLIGFISPLTQNFCADCNRIRITSSGALYSCLGSDNHVELRPFLREKNEHSFDKAIHSALVRKPLHHDFKIEADRVEGSPHRSMAVTGG